MIISESKFKQFIQEELETVLNDIARGGQLIKEEEEVPLIDLTKTARTAKTVITPVDKRYINKIDDHLGVFSYINDEEMKEIYYIIRRYKKRDELKSFINKYSKITGDNLVEEIKDIDGVHKWKSKTLWLFGVKPKKDIYTKATEWKEEALPDTFQDVSGTLFSLYPGFKALGYLQWKIFRIGAPQWRIGAKFAMGSTSPYTERDLYSDEISEISAFLKMIFNADKKMLKGAPRRYKKYFKANAQNMRKNGEYRFGDEAFGCGKGAYCYYAAMRSISGEAGFQANPASTIGKLKNMMGQFTVYDKGSYWLVKDTFDFNDWINLTEDPGFKGYYTKIVTSLEGGKDQLLGKDTPLGQLCAHNQQSGAGSRTYNVARCWLPIRHAFMPGDKWPWETGALKKYKGFPVRLKIPK